MMIHLIKEIVGVEPFKITVRFNTGEVRLINLADKLNEWATSPHSKFAELKNYEVFKQVKLDRDFETLVWENGIDLCPDVLYEISTEISKKNVA
ncbi:DUF2442 domain-containing protein [Botryobacter ruber]|uniref:DUF2442 domain-containing protein n=1 Tax=Botryobacter ruber TaxID=2171629 RepID=UPI000E0B7F8C|nr:DUF2442 domain-containing protein [Botryobacter ruber]